MQSCNHAISQNNEWTSLVNKEVEPVESVQMNIYQSNIYSKDLVWLHFDNDLRTQEKQRKRKQTCIFVFLTYLTFPSSSQEHQPRHGNIISCKAYGRFIEITSNLRRKKLHRTNLSTNFLGGSFNNRDKKKKEIRKEINLEEKDSPNLLECVNVNVSDVAYDENMCGPIRTRKCRSTN